MTREANEMQQAVARTLRDSLGKLQRASEELNQAVNDLVAACASTRPANALSPMLRAQTSAASLAASLEVLSRFVTGALQSGAPLMVASAPQLSVPDEPGAPEVASAVPESAAPEKAAAAPVQESAAAPSAALAETAPVADLPFAATHAPSTPEQKHPDPLLTPAPPETVAPMQASDVVEDSGAIGHLDASVGVGDLPEDLRGQIQEKTQETVQEVLQAFQQPAAQNAPPAAPAHGFDLSGLPADEQELHRRASRVAKVSMQDIKMLRPNDVRLGKEQKDLCWRLRDDLEKAHKEYDRRFQAILGHPVDYFYDWLVEILADGDPKLLGEYPYHSPVLRH